MFREKVNVKDSTKLNWLKSETWHYARIDKISFSQKKNAERELINAHRLIHALIWKSSAPIKRSKYWWKKKQSTLENLNMEECGFKFKNVTRQYLGTFAGIFQIFLHFVSFIHSVKIF